MSPAPIHGDTLESLHDNNINQFNEWSLILIANAHLLLQLQACLSIPSRVLARILPKWVFFRYKNNTIIPMAWKTVCVFDKNNTEISIFMFSVIIFVKTSKKTQGLKDSSLAYTLIPSSMCGYNTVKVYYNLYYRPLTCTNSSYRISSLTSWSRLPQYSVRSFSSSMARF